MSTPNALTYARYHCLTLDFRSQNVLNLLDPVQEPAVVESEQLPEAIFPTFEELLKEEKLEMSRQAGVYLTENLKTTCKVDWNTVLDDHRKNDKLKLEMPLLRSNHEKDMKWFTERISLESLISDFVETPVMSTEYQPSHCPPDFETRCLKEASRFENEILTARLEITKDTLIKLASIHQNDWTRQDDESVIMHDLNFMKIQPQTTIFEEIGQQSSPGSDLDQEDVNPDILLPDVEETPEQKPHSSIILLPPISPVFKIMHGDEQNPHHSLSSFEIEDCSGQQDFKNVTKSNNELIRITIPQLSTVSIVPPWRIESQTKFLEDHLPKRPLYSFLDKQEHELNWVPLPSSLAQFNLSEIIDDAGSAEYLIEKPEKVVKSDQLLWKEPGLRLLSTDEDSDEELDESEYTDSSSINEPGNILPQKRKLGTEDWSRRIKISEPISHCENVPSDEPDDSVKRTNQFMPRNRNNHILRAISNLTTTSIKRPDSHTIPRNALIPPPGESSDHCFSASSSLSTFLDLRCKKFKPVEVPKQQVSEEKEDSIEPSQPSVNFEAVNHSQTEVKAARYQPEADVQVPCSQISDVTITHEQDCHVPDRLEGDRVVFMDSALVQNRALTRLLDERGGTQLTIIYRELKSNPPIILNPNTCLLYTTIQSLSQKPLPGQTRKNPQITIQTQIQGLTTQYERIFVLISCPKPQHAPVSETYRTIMGDFASWCAGFECGDENASVRPIWIYLSDSRNPDVHDSVAEWTWRLICRHSFSCSILPNTATFLDSETLWESFLVRSGMNYMAAQVVMVTLSKHDSSITELASGDQIANSARFEPWGLRRFVQMDITQKRDTWSYVLGEKMLNRVDELIARKSAS